MSEAPSPVVLAPAAQCVVAVTADPAVRDFVEVLLAPDFQTVACETAQAAISAMSDATAAVLLHSDHLDAGARIRQAQPDLPIVVYATKAARTDAVKAINAFQPFAWVGAKEAKKQLHDCVRRAAERRAQWRAQTFTDALTGVANRRQFFAEYQKILQQAVRTKRPFAVLIIDVDAFRAINSQFGTPHGDAVLKDVSYILRDNARSIDVLGRIGGDQFALALPETDLTGARGCGDRLVRGVESFHLAPRDSEGHSLSLAIGGCVLSGQDPVVADDFFTTALRALEAAKRQGAGQVACVTYGEV